MMNIHSFEAEVRGVIVARGFDYYENGNVVDAEYLEDNTYSFFVEGTKNYEVTVKLDESGVILFSDCDCPYNMGDVCKHEVAAYFELRDILDEETPEGNNQLRKKLDMKSILNQLAKDSLIDIILDITRKDPVMRETIIFKYAKVEPEQEINKSQALIAEIIKKFTGWEGFISYRNTYHFANELGIVLDKVKSETDFLVALDIAGILLENTIEAIQYSDDSDGSIGSLINETIDAIGELVEDTETFDEKERFLDKLITLSENEIFDDWAEYRIDLLSICLELIDDEILRDRFTNQLESMLLKQTADDYNEYQNGMILRLLFDMLKTHGTDDEVQCFSEKHVTYTFFREELIQRSRLKGDYQEVLKLAIAGEKQDKGFWGLISKWKKIRYTAYKALSMKDEQRSLGRELLLVGDVDYYSDLKELAQGREKELYEELKQSLKAEKHYRTNSIYLQLVEEENDVIEMLAYVRENPKAIARFTSQLLVDYQREVIELWEMNIKNEAKSSKNRKQYQNVCSIIRDFKEIVNQANYQRLISELAEKYKNRPAFLDELRKVN